MADVRDLLKTALGDSYTLERELTGGGMSRVFVARDRTLDRSVVIKTLPPELAAEVSAERFRREVSVAARLQHPHIVPVHAAGSTGDVLYYTMPFVEGESLRARLKRESTLDVAQTLQILTDVVEALEYAHAQGIVHRDIKPDNVLLAHQHALVTDFGIAKALSLAESRGANTLTAVGVSVGTPAYMAPEQAAGDPGADHRADIYAVGVLAYEMLAGRPPFLGTTPQAVIAGHLASTPTPLLQLSVDTPAALAALVMRCLEKDPERRPQSAAELLAQLTALRSGVSHKTLPWLATPRRRVSRIAVASALTLAIILAAVAMLRMRSAADLNANRVLVAPLQNETGDSTLDPLGHMAADWLTQGLAQTGLVEVLSPASAPRPPSDGPRTEVRAIDLARSLAMSSGAGTVVGGSYYRMGDSIRFQARVIAPEDGRIIRALPMVAVPANDPARGIVELQKQVMGALATLANPKFGSFASVSSQPPTYEAYQEYSQGLELFVHGRGVEAIPHFLAVTEHYPSFTMPALWAGVAYWEVGRCATADSIADAINRQRDRLATMDRYMVDWIKSSCSGKLADALQYTRLKAKLAPGSDMFAYVVAFDAMRNNRPAEALDVLRRVDPSRSWMREWTLYWETATDAHHASGDFQGEIEASERGQKQFPGQLILAVGELRGLAARGRIPELRAKSEAILGLGPTPYGSSAGDVLVSVAQELSTHGHAADAPFFTDKAIAWQRAHGAAARAGLARALYVAGTPAQLAEARSVVAALAAKTGSDLNLLGWRGVVAAAQRDTVEARRVDAALEAMNDKYLLGAQTLWRARIAAELGERETAVSRLRDAFREGLTFDASLHAEHAFRALRDDAAFQALLRPKG